MNGYPTLFSPVRLGSLELPNRVVMAPMATNYADAQHRVTERLIAYHAARARGGVGLIVVEHTAVDPLGLTAPRMLGIFGDHFVPGLRRLVEAVHQAGGRIALQLQHGGRQASPEVIGQECLSPSAVAAGRDRRVPREMTVAQIRHVVQAFGQAAHRAQRAGFDGVEIHMAHGYLGCSFLSPLLNRRTDAYGGDIERRTRFAAEVMQAIRKRCGPALPVWCRVSAEEFVAGGQTLGEMLEICPLLQAQGYCAVHASAAIGETAHMASAPYFAPEGHLLPLAEALARVVAVPVIGVGNLRTPSFVERILSNGRCDLIALGRALLADPDWCVKVKEGREREVIPCIYCCLACSDRRRTQTSGAAPVGPRQPLAAPEGDGPPEPGGPNLVECTTNPWTGHEAEWPDWPGGPAAAPARRVLVVGGGPAGMTAAIVAARRGHHVTLWERTATLGGRLTVAGRAGSAASLAALLDHLAAGLDEAGVEVIWQTEATAGGVEAAQPEVVVVATGAEPLNAWDVLSVAPRVPAMTAAHYLQNPDSELLSPVAILGGDETGCLAALEVVAWGHEAMVFERGEHLAASLPNPVRQFVLRRLAQGRVRALTSCRALSLEPGRVTALVEGEETRTVECGSILTALGRRSREVLAADLAGLGIEVHVIGDARRLGTLHEVIWEGANLGRQI